MTIQTTRSPRRVNYLNNRDLLKQIHLSKNSYCSFKNPELDHQFDIILDDLSQIALPENITAAKQARADRIERDTGIKTSADDIATEDLVFRVTTWDHIPIAPVKITKAAAAAAAKERKKIAKDIAAGLISIDGDEENDNDDDIAIDPESQNPKYIRLNFPPFIHYRLDTDLKPYIVGKSHWKGDIDSGEFCKEHGNLTDELARMCIKLCERYATRGNWRGYCVDELTQALTQRGWLTHNELTTADTILSYDGQRLAWSSIASIFKDQFTPQTGRMHAFTAEGVDALVTPGHKFVTTQGLCKIEDLVPGDSLVLIAPGPDNTNTVHREQDVVAAAVFSSYPFEPVAKHANSNLYSVTLPHAVAESVAAQLSLHKTAVEYTIDADQTTVTVDLSLLPDVCALLKDTTLDPAVLHTLNNTQLNTVKSIFESASCYYQQLSNTKQTQLNYVYVHSKAAADVYQTVCTLCGQRSSFVSAYCSSLHVVYLHSNEPVPLEKFAYYTAGNSTSPVANTEYNGVVWCPETEYGSFVARRNGRVYLTGNTYNEEMRGQALLQLSQIALQFNEARSQNPFSYYTASISNSFTRIFNIEKRVQNTRDDILEINGLTPSWTRQNSEYKAQQPGPVTILTGQALADYIKSVENDQ